MSDAAVTLPAARAYVGLGGNVGEPDSVLRAAMVALEDLPGTSLQARSRLYRSAPWGRTDQASFVNAVVELSTTLDPQGLLRALLGIERRFGRVRATDGSDRWGPRILDLDLLLFDDQVLDLPGLRLPHPRLHERAFVLVPLLELAPALVIPGIGPAGDVARALGSGGVEAIG